MTLDEEIMKLDLIASDAFEGGDANEFRQLAEWLRELKTYRKLIANADKLIESEYGVVIIEGYKDVLTQMKEIYEEVNADDRN
ncbi:hypothetical protein [Sharpea azabuensis]|uniref:hypothetical protein n=1 Tax=Sharpea azabuensis TaxID=322505 RepID=UPI002E7FF846|nr:hypothetical protein [Sharpea azabuensis]MEE3307876.1 hypothetical protein [Sharpea azabuensis]